MILFIITNSTIYFRKYSLGSKVPSNITKLLDLNLPHSLVIHSVNGVTFYINVVLSLPIGIRGLSILAFSIYRNIVFMWKKICLRIKTTRKDMSSRKFHQDLCWEISMFLVEFCRLFSLFIQSFFQ